MTAVFDDASTALFGALRERHFPAAINIVPAHCTLFHHLPGAEQGAVTRLLRERCSATPACAFAGAGLRFLGRGVAVELKADRLTALRSALASGWRDWLTPQDRQGFRPHVTVQNKAAPEEARALHAELSLALPPIAGTIEGLALWHYRGGPWTPAGRFPFAARGLAES